MPYAHATALPVPFLLVQPSSYGFSHSSCATKKQKTIACLSGPRVVAYRTGLSRKADTYGSSTLGTLCGPLDITPGYGAPVEDFLERGPFHLREMGTWEPAVEVADTKEAVVVKAQVPDISKENLQVNVTDDTLTLKGEIKEEEKKKENYSCREIQYSAFVRTITLPAAVQAEKASAQMKDGILEITIPTTPTGLFLLA
jgi:HSP20 family molecular chaperone IbpA